MDKTSSMDPENLPILRYVRQCLEAKGWTVRYNSHPRDQVTFYGSKRVGLRKVKLTIQVVQPINDDNYYLTKFCIENDNTNLCDPKFVLEQHSKLLHPVEEGQLWDLWKIENGLGLSKFLAIYDKIAADLGYPMIFQGKH